MLHFRVLEFGFTVLSGEVTYMNCDWVCHLRTILEMAYFVAGIVIAILAGIGLKQITLTKRIAKANAKRESVKFAAERCQYYAETCVSLQSGVVTEYTKLGLTFFKNPPAFEIVDGEIRPQLFVENSMVIEFQKMPEKIITLLNSMEAFAIPFAAGVADDEIGFQETSSTFCGAVQQLIGAVIVLRKTGVRFESLIKVYDRWQSRIVAQNMEGKLKLMQLQHKQAAEKGKIRPPEAY